MSCCRGRHLICAQDQNTCPLLAAESSLCFLTSWRTSPSQEHVWPLDVDCFLLFFLLYLIYDSSSNSGESHDFLSDGNLKMYQLNQLRVWSSCARSQCHNSPRLPTASCVVARKVNISLCAAWQLTEEAHAPSWRCSSALGLHAGGRCGCSDHSNNGNYWTSATGPGRVMPNQRQQPESVFVRHIPTTWPHTWDDLWRRHMGSVMSDITQHEPF